MWSSVRGLAQLHFYQRKLCTVPVRGLTWGARGAGGTTKRIRVLELAKD